MTFGLRLRRSLTTSAVKLQERKLKTFDNQKLLPRLPIPTLQETTGKYLQSLKPILSMEEISSAQKAIEEFNAGIGPKLQQRLQEYDKTQKNSWLEEFWLRKAYWEWREPLMINSNWWLQFKDGDDMSDILKSPPPKGEFSSLQLERSARIISKLLDIKDIIESEEMAPEFMGKKKVPLCMNQYRMQFGISRIPDIPGDYIFHEFPSTAKHIIVMLEDQIYVLDVLGPNGERYSTKQLEQMLENTVSLHKSLETRQPPIGILTSEHRDKWAKLRKQLTDASQVNKESLSLIDQSLFAICLDNFATSEDVDVSHRIIFHGANGKNRWFDKSLSFIFMSNGRGGCNGEHSPSDAVIPGQIMDYILKNEYNPDFKPSAPNLKLKLPKLIEWEADDESVQKAMDDASTRAETDIEDLDSVLLHFNSYGAERIKSRAKCPPDAFVQMAMQLAYYRTYDECCPTYESASTRQFLHGRTETIRSCSMDSLAFTKAFDDDQKSDGEKIDLLKRAVETHSNYARDATNGHGCDRHLLGLRLMLKEGDRAPLFEDSAYLKSMNFKLSTSNVSPGDYYYGGFGPIVPEGYGVNYAIGQDKLKFSISTRRSSADTCSRSFRKVLEGTLTDLMNLFN